MAECMRDICHMTDTLARGIYAKVDCVNEVIMVNECTRFSSEVTVAETAPSS